MNSSLAYRDIRFALRDSHNSFRYIVENIGVEPMTSCVQGKRSSQLS